MIQVERPDAVHGDITCDLEKGASVKLVEGTERMIISINQVIKYSQLSQLTIVAAEDLFGSLSGTIWLMENSRNGQQSHQLKTNK